ncbi:MAG: alpha/beta hydrolase [Comamonadaceae bacterium]|nr:MAG: alpha/beta hydrolase [Comamonadaceae bacterium]
MHRQTAPAVITAADASEASLTRLDQQISISPLAPLNVRFYGRKALPGSHSAAGLAVPPLVIHFHAGAFVAGSLDTGSSVAQLLADAGAVVMSIDYPLAPAHPFPQAVEAGYAALAWAFKARQKLAGKGAQVFVAGEEAGGNLAAAVALMARDQHGPELAGQILLSPMLDPCMATSSLRCADAGPVGCTWADGWHQYLARIEDACHPYAAPGLATRLTGVPPTLLLTASDDPLRDEALAYAERLREAGRPVLVDVLPGPTGWPASYLGADGRVVTWAPAVRAHFQEFFDGLAVIDHASTGPAVSRQLPPPVFASSATSIQSSRST